MSRIVVAIVSFLLFASCNEPPESSPPRITESAFVAFDAKTNRASSALWQYSDARITLRVEAKETRTGYRVEVFTAIPAVADARIFTCDSIRTQGGHVDFILRGKHLHILCINPPTRRDKGSTQGGRFRFQPDQLKLISNGTYGGEGIFDIDSVELDEGIHASELDH